jgi:hypothetical protein
MNLSHYASEFVCHSQATIGVYNIKLSLSTPFLKFFQKIFKKVLRAKNAAKTRGFSGVSLCLFNCAFSRK